MPVFTSCLCFRDLRSGTAAAGTFTMAVSFFQLMLQIGLWAGAGGTADHVIAYPPFLLYVPLAALDFLVLVMSMVMMIGSEREYRSRSLLTPWIVVMVMTLLYEACVNLYFLAVMFPLSMDPTLLFQGQLLGLGITVHLSRLIVLLFYWIVKLIICMMCLLCVISRYQELCPQQRPQWPPREQWPTTLSSAQLQEPAHGAKPYTPPSFYDDERRNYNYKSRDTRRYYDSYDRSRPYVDNRPYRY